MELNSGSTVCLGSSGCLRDSGYSSGDCRAINRRGRFSCTGNSGAVQSSGRDSFSRNNALRSCCPGNCNCVRSWSSQDASRYGASDAFARPRSRQVHRGRVRSGPQVRRINISRAICIFTCYQINPFSGWRCKIPVGDAAVPAISEIDVCGETVLY